MARAGGFRKTRPRLHGGSVTRGWREACLTACGGRARAMNTRPGTGAAGPRVSSWELLPTPLRVSSADLSSMCRYEEVYRRDECYSQLLITCHLDPVILLHACFSLIYLSFHFWNQVQFIRMSFKAGLRHPGFTPKCFSMNIVK